AVTRHRSRPEPDAALIIRAARRLGVQAAAFVAVVAVVLTGTAVLVVLDAQHESATALLDDAVARADDVDDPPNDVYLVIRTGGVEQTSAGLPVGVPD